MTTRNPEAIEGVIKAQKHLALHKMVIKEKMSIARITQQELADELGISQVQLSRILSTKNEITKTKLIDFEIACQKEKIRLWTIESKLVDMLSEVTKKFNDDAAIINKCNQMRIFE